VRRWTLMSAFVVISLLPGCTHLTRTSATEVCAVWRPVGWSSRDTPETVTEVKANNARRAAWCGTLAPNRNR
jgi:hypothetical protein